MVRSLLIAIVVLPGTVVGAVPALILWLTHGTAYGGRLADPTMPGFWIAVLAVALGLTLAVSTVRLFVRVGRGTPAPWAPPERLVIAGVYRHVRNPMISGVIALLLGEALLFQSLPLLGWTVFAALANALYIPLVEEPGLERRFGEDYRRYKAKVPRWMPRLRPWREDTAE